MTSKIILGFIGLLLVIIVGSLLFFFIVNKREPVDPDSAVETNEVVIQNGEFSPDTIKVKAGTTVTWTNNDRGDHIVASDPHPIHTSEPDFESKRLRSGDSYSYTFNEPGEYLYHCHIQPGLKGAVIVE